MNVGGLGVVILGIIATCSLTVASQKPGAPSLRITVYDQTHLTQEIKQSVFDLLRLIFRHAGIAVELFAGDSTADEASLFTYSALPPESHEEEAACRARRDIALKLTSVSPPGLRETVLGIASPLAITGLNARVFNDHIGAAAFRQNRPYAIVLSYAIAHEIGHVLLRTNYHAAWGLMSGVWTGHEYKQMAPAGFMFFTRAEAERMLVGLRGIGCR